jgi:hypothetical protein
MRKQWKRGGPRRELYDRFWEKVSRNGRCWEWAGSRHKSGYGRINQGGIVLYAHRLAYEFAFGDAMPAGLSVCHHCDNPPCCNPAHLFLGTAADNANDKARKGRTVNPLTDALKRRTHCPRGHPYDASNTVVYLRPGFTRPVRRCRECIRTSWGKRA